ncbi:craniofacial development protein 2-like [Palaemon carinicauda]|uniref:craniofacial development protein 2-like n=1 Tax=Palaemon carinicauda TaxID=392227 RepID=UPI0035B66A90
MGVEGLGEVSNENRAYFTGFSSANTFVIEGAVFQHKKIYKYTWPSSCGNYKNQIDHIVINKERRRTLRYIRRYRVEDIGSDHKLLIALLKLKLKASNKKKDKIPTINTTKLLEEEDREKFVIECINRFVDLDKCRDKEQTIIEQWCDIKDIYQSVGSEVLGHAVTRRKPWISDDTWGTLKRRKTEIDCRKFLKVMKITR